MKILHVITKTDLGGAQAVVIKLAHCAISDGHTVAVASMTGGPLWTQLSEFIVQFQIDSLTHPLHTKQDIKAFFTIKKILKIFNPDIIHLHSSKAGALGRLAAGKYKNRIVYTVHGFDTIRIGHPKFLFIEKALQNLCAQIVAVSNQDQQNMIACGFKSPKVIYNAIQDFSKDISVNPEIAALFEAAKKDGKKIILSIARIAKPKRLDLFLQTAQALADKPYMFYWIGAATDKSILTDEMQVNLPSNVKLLGDVPSARNYLQFCDLFLLLTDHEGMPITILEAFAAAKPILASNKGGIPEMFQTANGVLTTNSVADIISQIQNILENPDKIAELKKNARSTYESMYTLPVMWHKYAELYQSIAKTQDNK